MDKPAFQFGKKNETSFRVRRNGDSANKTEMPRRLLAPGRKV